jgi:mono/diheme cytochrome c family protein
MMPHCPASISACRGLALLARSLPTACLTACWIATSFLASAQAADPAANSDSAGAELFRKSVAPLLEAHCLECHQGSKPKGALSLVDVRHALAGGESGAAIVPGKPEESLLVEYISGDKPEMPKDAPPLTAGDVESIRQWISAGAAWPEDLALTSKKVIDTRWWSLLPLKRPAVPHVNVAKYKSRVLRGPVDAFVLAKLHANKLEPSREADRRTLIRRVYFDLTGLPPSPEEVDAFIADPDPLAYEKLVDRLLDSPRYGERWARHWLDVVHYGESHGYDKDQPRPNAWPYRDYVIRAFNSDKPYKQFIEEQVAGDVLHPGTADGIEALGFISAGPWDFIGHAEVPESKFDGKVARHLDRDDMVGTTMNTFVSFTVQCAQCHDHKFDPITQEDYYSLQAVFAALDRADKMYDADPAISKQRATLVARQTELKKQSDAADAKVRGLAGSELAELDKQIAAKRSGTASVQGVEFGYHSALTADANVAKWVQVDLGNRVPIERLTYTACYDDFNSIGAGFGFPQRFKIEVSDDPAFKTDVQIVVDETGADFPNPGTQPQQITPVGMAGRYVRLTATKLAPRMNDFNFALAELAVFDAAGTNQALRKTVTALDSIEAAPRWSTKNLVDGLTPIVVGGPDDKAASLEKLNAQRQALLDRVLDEPTRRQQEQTTAELAAVTAELAKLPPGKVVYAGTVYTSGSAFSGTGPFGGKPRKICILPRGDLKNPGKEVGPGALSRLTALAGRFELPADHAEGDRRAALARWLTDDRNPLTWRSIVNRVWLYHFGRGLVDTPNDFGRMGQLPSHPELLDWLAVEFRDGGGSIKQLHRLLLTSATYRQSSAVSPQAAAVDAQNVWYSHANRRRLEAEAIRDSVLAVSGQLDLKMYGPSFRDFVVEKPEHSPHYQYNLYNPEDPASHRRSIYRFIVRSQQQPFLAALDCADPSLMVDKRNQTITPLAALALLNNQLTVVMAKHFAARVATSGPDPQAQLTAAFRLALGRSPTADELAPLVAYAAEYGLPSACRVIMNLNEFVFVD